MEALNFRPVHGQLVDMFVLEILEGRIKPGEMLPRTVDFAMRTKLNPAIIRNAYKELTDIKVASVFADGWKVRDDAMEVLRELERKRFLRHDVPSIARRMDLIGVDPDRIDWRQAAKEAAAASTKVEGIAQAAAPKPKFIKVPKPGEADGDRQG